MLTRAAFFPPLSFFALFFLSLICLRDFLVCSKRFTLASLYLCSNFFAATTESWRRPPRTAWLRANTDRLAADVVLVSDTSLFAPGVPSIAYGLRGLAYVEVSLTGPAKDLHSGVYGGGVENPINALAAMIADLHDDDHRDPRDQQSSRAIR